MLLKRLLFTAFALHHSVLARSGIKQRVEEGAPDAQAQDDFLPLLHAPTAAVHHPQEVGLHPTHAAEAVVRTAEVAMLNGVATNGRSISLIDDNAGVVMVSKDVLALFGPFSGLLKVGRGCEFHVQFSLLFYGKRRITSMVPMMLSFKASRSSAGTHHSV